MPPEAFDIPEFCRRYRVGRSFTYTEIASGRLTARKAGRRTLILSADAEAWAQGLPVAGGILSGEETLATPAGAK